MAKAFCAECGEQVADSEPREPCGNCGSMLRSFVVRVEAATVALVGGSASVTVSPPTINATARILPPEVLTFSRAAAHYAFHVAVYPATEDSGPYILVRVDDVTDPGSPTLINGVTIEEAAAKLGRYLSDHC